MTNYYIVDIDGTVADCSHRLHHIRNSPPNWEAFFAECMNDKPIENVCYIINDIREGSYNRIVFVSGRSDIVRKETRDWLMNNSLWDGYLYMRKHGDHRPDHVVKMEILEEVRKEFGGDPIAVFDDRSSVVDAWRRAGLTCFQVAEWNESAKLYPHGTLYMMVGPSGAGKTKWIENNLYWTQKPIHIIRTDELRLKICGDFKDQSENERVFSIAHEEIKTYITHGVDVVFDATNIRNRDRRAVRDLVKEMKIVYVVVDRPLEDKLRDRDWRSEELIKKHDQVFKSNLNAIMAGDNDPRVTVWDRRVL